MADHIVFPDPLEDLCSRLMMAENVPEDEARIIGQHLVEAECFGLSSHGVSRTAIYVKRLHEGVVNPKWSYKALQEYPAAIQWDACNSMGMVTGVRAMERCIEKAREAGSCVIAANHSNHFGMAGHYAAMAAREGMIGFCISNAPPNIAPWGSHKAYVGTNPISIAAPRRGEPMLLDIAPSVVAMGKVILAAKLGQSIPEGWAQTADGRPTTDPNEGQKGTVLPIGGHKGYGLSLFVDVVSGILSGAQFGPYLNNMWNDFVNPQDVGHFFAAIDISKFVGLDVFVEKIEKMAADIKALPKNPGVEEIFLPGEIEERKKAKAEKEGLVLSDVVYNELCDLAATYGIPAGI
ncbi:MAG: Ldh family oxidoreductase [Oscillospiraceae bacterium]|nr:Ldh family oxidoreductase [Oscillospiraceae bacterium]